MSIKISTELLKKIIISQSYTTIFEVLLERNEILELTFIGANDNGVFIYSSKKGNVGIRSNWVKMPDISYKMFVEKYLELGDVKNYFEITPKLKLTDISYSDNDFATATIDTNIVRFKLNIIPEIKQEIAKEKQEQEISNRRHKERERMEAIRMRRLEEERKIRLENEKIARRERKFDKWLEYQINDFKGFLGCLSVGIVLFLIFLGVFYLSKLF